MGTIDFSYSEAFDLLYRIGLAYLLAVPIGINRETSERNFGLRTFPLVAAGACGYMSIGLLTLDGDDPVARVLYGIVTGIGFIGGGAIVKASGGVSGTATAASIWNTGAIGVAVAVGEIEVACILSLLNFMTLVIFGSIKHKIHKGEETKHPQDPDANESS